MKKTVEITIDIAVARMMLDVAGFSSEKLCEASDDEVFEKVLGMMGCYGATFEIKE